MIEKHRWADLLQDVPIDPALSMGDGSFPMPLELRQSIAVHLENLGFQLPGGPRMHHVSPSADMMMTGATGGWVAEGGETHGG